MTFDLYWKFKFYGFLFCIIVLMCIFIISVIKERSEKDKVCANCQYMRPANMLPAFPNGEWCSNSKSSQSLKYVYSPKANTCNQFVEKGKKAPLWMRLLNKVMK